MKHSHVRPAIVILARFILIVEWHIIQLGFLTYIPYSNGMFDALAKRPLMSALAGMKHNILKHFSSNISNTRDSVSSGYPNTEKRVENTTRSGVFLTKFECLMYLLNRNKN